MKDDVTITHLISGLGTSLTQRQLDRKVGDIREAILACVVDERVLHDMNIVNRLLVKDKGLFLGLTLMPSVQRAFDLEAPPDSRVNGLTEHARVLDVFEKLHSGVPMVSIRIGHLVELQKAIARDGADANRNTILNLSEHDKQLMRVILKNGGRTLQPSIGGRTEDIQLPGVAKFLPEGGRQIHCAVQKMSCDEATIRVIEDIGEADRIEARKPLPAKPIQLRRPMDRQNDGWPLIFVAMDRKITIELEVNVALGLPDLEPAHLELKQIMGRDGLEEELARMLEECKASWTEQ